MFPKRRAVAIYYGVQRANIGFIRFREPRGEQEILILQLRYVQRIRYKGP